MIGDDEQWWPEPRDWPAFAEDPKHPGTRAGETEALALLLLAGVVVPLAAKSGDGERDVPGMCVLCSDTFAWACADAEPLPLLGFGADLEAPFWELYDLVRTGTPWAGAKWCALRRNERPMPPVERRMREVGLWCERMDALPPWGPSQSLSASTSSHSECVTSGVGASGGPALSSQPEAPSQSSGPSPSPSTLTDAERPPCSGEWLRGSGGHRVHGPCGALADWWHPDDLFAYCDAHLSAADRGAAGGPGEYLPWPALAIDGDHDDRAVRDAAVAAGERVRAATAEAYDDAVDAAALALEERQREAARREALDHLALDTDTDTDTDTDIDTGARS